MPQPLHPHLEPPSTLELYFEPLSLPCGRPSHLLPRFPDRTKRRHAARKMLPQEALRGPPGHQCHRRGHSPLAHQPHRAARYSMPPHRAYGSLNERSAYDPNHPSSPPTTSSLSLQRSRQAPHPLLQTRRSAAACSRPLPSQIPSGKWSHRAHKQVHGAPSPSHKSHRPSPDTDRFSQRTLTAHHRPLARRSHFRHRHLCDTTSRAHSPYKPFPTSYV